MKSTRSTLVSNIDTLSRLDLITDKQESRIAEQRDDWAQLLVTGRFVELLILIM